MNEKLKKGFTLIELLIVVAIIAILAAIAVPNFLEAQVRAKVSRAQADMRTIATCIESYAVDNNVYPTFKVFGYHIANTNCPGESAFLGASVTGAQDPAGGTACGVSSRLIWITTPIAYCSSVLPEAFNTKGTALGAVTGDQAKFYDTYDFLNARSFSPDGVLSGRTEGAAFTSGAQWRLSSSGPDGIQAFGGRDAAAGATNESNELGADYDSSNGTISAGDIIRVGGGQGTLPNRSAFTPYYYRVGNTLKSVNNMPPVY